MVDILKSPGKNLNESGMNWFVDDKIQLTRQNPAVSYFKVESNLREK